MGLAGIGVGRAIAEVVLLRYDPVHIAMTRNPFLPI